MSNKSAATECREHRTTDPSKPEGSGTRFSVWTYWSGGIQN